jgi:hypothetical protein
VKAAQIVLEATTGLTLKVGGNFITIDASGVAIHGSPVVQINSAGAALAASAGALVQPVSPSPPAPADDARPGAIVPPASGSAEPGAPMLALRSNSPTHNPNDPDNKTKVHWIEIELFDEDGNPVPGECYSITLPDGSTVADGTLDNKGLARVDNIDPGTCKVTFPNLDGEAWEFNSVTG